MTTPTTDTPPIIAKPDDIDPAFAARAFTNTSFSPEQRGESRRREYADSVNGLYAELWPLAKTEEQQTLLAEEMERYRQGFLTRMNAYLASHSNVASAMIVGPARFPTARNQKRGQWADNKLNDLMEWDKRAREAIKRHLLDARPEEEKDAAEWAAIRRDIAGSLTVIEAIDAGTSPYTRSSFVNSIAGKIERLALAGDVPMVERSLNVLREYDQQHKKPALSSRHKVWTFDAIAKQVAAQQEARADKPQETLAEANGVTLRADYQLNRVQLVFPDKPDYGMREKLKRSGWKWAPSQEAWQRQLTSAGIASGKAIIIGLMPGPETPPLSTER